MIRIACLGNSHNAAVKLGWDEIKGTYPNITVDFFSGAANSMKGLEVKGGRIYPTSEQVREMFLAYAGHDSVAPDYDAYFLVGMGFGLVPLMSLFATHRPPRFYYREDGAHLISESLLTESRASLIERSPAVNCLRLVRTITSEAPVLMIPNPLPSIEILQTPAGSYWSGQELLEDCTEYLDRAIGKLTDVIYTPQPRGTLEGEYFTKAHFAKDARLLKPRWTRPTNEGDPYHMNAAYGAHVLSQIFAHIGVLPSQQAEAESA